jgi:hypothetical protein
LTFTSKSNIFHTNNTKYITLSPEIGGNEMNGMIWLIIYFAILVIFYAVILSQKGELKRIKTSLKSQDWIFFFSGIFGGVVLGQALLDSGIKFPAEIMLMIMCAFFVILLIYAIIRKKKTGIPMVQMMGDERMNLIYAKSSRNALFATYLVLFINSCFGGRYGLDMNWMLIMLASGVFVLFASVYIYYFKKS